MWTCTSIEQSNFGRITMVRIDLITRLRALVVRKPATKTPDDWRERLARYKRWFEDGEEWAGPQTDEEKANLCQVQAILR